jgi:hypothetical protein
MVRRAGRNSGCIASVTVHTLGGRLRDDHRLFRGSGGVIRRPRQADRRPGKCAIALYPVARHWALRALAVAYPLMTTLVVVATGNHFFFDVIAGALLACVTGAVVTRAGAWLAGEAATRRDGRGRHPSGPAGLPARGRSSGG